MRRVARTKDRCSGETCCTYSLPDVVRSVLVSPEVLTYYSQFPTESPVLVTTTDGQRVLSTASTKKRVSMTSLVQEGEELTRTKTTLSLDLP